MWDEPDIKLKSDHWFSFDLHDFLRQIVIEKKIDSQNLPFQAPICNLNLCLQLDITPETAVMPDGEWPISIPISVY